MQKTKFIGPVVLWSIIENAIGVDEQSRTAIYKEFERLQNRIRQLELAAEMSADKYNSRLYLTPLIPEDESTTNPR